MFVEDIRRADKISEKKVLKWTLLLNCLYFCVQLDRMVGRLIMCDLKTHANYKYILKTIKTHILVYFSFEEIFTDKILI